MCNFNLFVSYFNNIVMVIIVIGIRKYISIVKVKNIINMLDFGYRYNWLIFLMFILKRGIILMV